MNITTEQIPVYTKARARLYKLALVHRIMAYYGCFPCKEMILYGGT